MRVSEICVKQIRVNQGLGVHGYGIRVHLGTLFSFHALYLKGDLASSAKVPYS